MAAWQNTPMRVIFLRKGKSEKGTAAEGDLFKYTYKSLDRLTAIARAHKRLENELPEENTLAWTVVSDG